MIAEKPIRCRCVRTTHHLHHLISDTESLIPFRECPDSRK
jgi:hypothetical protein